MSLNEQVLLSYLPPGMGQLSKLVTKEEETAPWTDPDAG